MGVEDILEEYFQEAQNTALSYDHVYSVDTISCSVFKWHILWLMTIRHLYL